MNSSPLRIAFLGAGGRGSLFTGIASQIPDMITVAAIADPDAAKVRQLADRVGVPAERRFASWQDFLAAGIAVDGVVITTMDQDHVEPAEACLARGFHVLLEKPMAPTLAECKRIVAAQEKSGKILSVCHSMRYRKEFSLAKQMLRQGAIGRIMTIDLIEQVGFWHQAHSFVRGNWGNSTRAVPMLLAKSCHDLDYLAYLVGAPALRVASVGHLSYFTEANAPPGAPARCTDGCPHETTCAYSALKQYVHTSQRHEWPASVCSPTDHSLEAHLAAMRSGPYGRCVWRCDNDVVDHQVVMFEFPGQVTATFTMTGFTKDGGRRLRVHGTLGVLEMDEQEITIKTFASGNEQRTRIAPESGEHGGGDVRLLRNWIDALRTGDPSLVLTTAQESLRTHAMAFAAELSRREGRMVSLDELTG